jgi:hypothetical protein
MVALALAIQYLKSSNRHHIPSPTTRPNQPNRSIQSTARSYALLLRSAHLAPLLWTRPAQDLPPSLRHAAAFKNQLVVLSLVVLVVLLPILDTAHGRDAPVSSHRPPRLTC